MNILIYANSSYDIGTGHVMRCLALADFLKSKECVVTFMTDTSVSGNIAHLVTDKGYKLVEPSVGNIPHNTDWLIVDNYHVDKSFEAEARKNARFIMVIDDLADRGHDCDILLDQNLYNNMEDRYRDLVPQNCQLLLGPRYAILRDEFRHEREILRKRNGKVNRILVNFGGIDHVDMTSRTLDLLEDYEIETNVVMGKNSMHLSKVSQICDQNPHFKLHIQTTEMAKLLASSDLAIAAGGTSVWERCCLGLPGIIIAIAGNQVESSEVLAGQNLCFYAGFYNENDIEQKVSNILDYCISDTSMLKEQSKKMMLLLDGRGKEYIWEAFEHRKV